MASDNPMQFEPLKHWMPVKGRFLVISGPCSAESPGQVEATARELAATGLVSVFRAGIWKPRTRPKSFEGKGEEALRWVAAVKKQTGMLTAVEVATPKHVELCLEYGIDMLWIGARTGVNPFSVQEIAQALGGTNIPVMVKNPINPDIRLWTGIIERIYQAGISRIIAVHRGFNTYEKSIYRNIPLWEIPIEMKRLFPGLPMICDPSHIAGNRTLLPKVSQNALDLDMDGLMIESHCNPEKALTDARQQITPVRLEQLVKGLVLRKAAGYEKEPARELEAIRQQIDHTDHQILEFLSKRMQMVEKIAHLKKDNDITILQIERWNSIFKDRMKTGEAHGLDAAFLKKILELVHKESINIQTRIMNRENP